MQLLKITTTPLQYELQVEHARLEYSPQALPKADVQTTSPELQINSTNTSVKIDTYQARKSLGMPNTRDSVTIRANEANQSIDQVTRSYVEMGKQMSNVADGVTIGKIVNQKMLEQPQMYTAFLPSAAAEISWEPSQLRMSFTPSKSSYDWKLTQNEFSYTSGSVKMKILENASVDIEYIGGPLYIPRSADPNYVEPQA